MKLNLIFIVAIVLWLMSSGSLLADETILQVGGNRYSREQIKVVMAENGFDSPEQAVEKLQRDAVLARMGKKAESLYQEMFACGSDEFVSGPRLDDERAYNRHYVFMRWLLEKSRSIPVRFLSIDGYWHLLAGTEMVRVRSARGCAMSARDIQFTQAELEASTSEILARKDGAPYLSGTEFNAYVAENYEQIRLQFNRDTSLLEVRRSLVREMVEEKIASSMYPIQAGTFSGEEIDRQIAAVVEKEAFRHSIRLSNPALRTTQEMLAEIYSQYRQRQEAELAALRLALSGCEGSSVLPFPLLNAYRKAKVEAQKKSIAQALSASEIQAGQQKSSSFPLSRQDAVQQLTEAKYNALVSEAVQRFNIQF